MNSVEPGRVERGAASSKNDLDVEVLYDGDCPLCSSYARYSKLKADVRRLTLKNMREVDASEIALLRQNGLSPEEGVILRISSPAQEQTFQGAEAMGLLSSLDNSHSILSLVLRIMRFPSLGRAVFPLLRLGRAFLLRILRISAEFK